VTVGLPAVAYKKKFGTPIYFNVQDLWPENVQIVLGINIKPVIAVINKIVDKIYGASDKILCSSQSFVENIANRGVAREKLVFWPQFCPEPDLSDAEKPDIYSDDTCNIVFAGNLGDAQGLDLVVDAAQELRDTNIRWYLVGDGRARLRLEENVKAYGLENSVVFIGRVDAVEADRYVHFADCAYLSFKNNKIFNMTLPAKLQTYLACGTPILAAAGGESAQVVGSNGIGFVCPPEKAALVAAARKVSAMTAQERQEKSKAARAYYEANYSMDRLVTELETILTEEIKKQER
jgi:glycosyltransferase involved in cell wall biosynthesis